MPQNPIKVAIADDHLLFRKLLSDFLSKHHNISIEIHANDAIELLDKLSYTFADIVLLDIFMPKMNGIDAATIIVNEFPSTKIIVLSLCSEVNVIKAFLDIGIHAYLSKSEDPATVLEAIIAAAENRIHRSQLYTEALYLEKETAMKKKISKHSNLDEREKQIIQLLWEDKSNKEISDLVYLSVSSIEKIKQDMREKLEVRSIAGLFKYALIHGIISLKSTVHSQTNRNI